MSERSFQSSFGANNANDRTDWSRLQISSQRISQNVTEIQRMINQRLGSVDDKLHEVMNQLATDAQTIVRESAQSQPSISDRSLSNSSYLSRRTAYFDSKPVFGGNYMSRATRLAGTTPYSLSQRQHQLAPALRVNVNPTKRVIGVSDPLSTSSQRILEKLEKASTPLQDARRIPNSTSFKDYFQTSDLLHKASKRPKFGPPTHATPVVSHTPESTFRPKRWELRLVPDRSREATKTANETPVDQINCDTYLNDKSEFKSNETGGRKMTRVAEKRQERRGKIAFVEEEEEESDSFSALANVQPLKITSLPTFSFSTNATTTSSTTSKPLTTTVTKTSDTLESKSEFMFQPPVFIKRMKRKASEEEKNAKTFVFSDPPIVGKTSNLTNGLENVQKEPVVSAPAAAKPTSIDNTIQTANGSVATGLGFGDNLKSKKDSWTCISCFVPNEANQDSCVICSEAKPGLKPIANTLGVAGNKTLESKTVQGENWICGCLHQNASCDDQCKSCNKLRTTSKSLESSVAAKPTPKPIDNSANQTTNGSVASGLGWGDKFKPKSGSWTCSTCCVTNDADKDSCVACEVPKPGSKPVSNTLSIADNKTSELKIASNIFGSTPSPKNTLSTTTVQASNQSSSTPQFSSSPLPTFNIGQSTAPPVTNPPMVSFGSASAFPSGWGDKFKPKTGSWSCPICCVTNDADKNNCVACEEAKPGSKPVANTFSIADNKTSESKIPSDIFGASKPQNTSSLFTFGAPLTASSSAAPQTSKTTGVNISAESAPQPFTFGALNQSSDSLKKKTVSFDLSDKSEKPAETTPNKSSTESSFMNFQFGKTSEITTNAFKGFGSSNTSIFNSMPIGANATATALPVASNTSFTDKSKPSGTQSHNTSGTFMFGAPAATTSSTIASFSSPFSVKNTGTTPSTTSALTADQSAPKSLFSFGSKILESKSASDISATTPLTTSILSGEQSAPKNLFTFGASSTSKPLDSISSNQTNPLIPNSSLPSIPTLGFGSASTTKPLPTFGFGSGSAPFGSQSTPQIAAQPSTQPFSFNAQPTNFNFGQQAAASVTNPTPFAFGSSSASLGSQSAPQMPLQPPAQTSSAPQFNFNAQSSSIFGQPAATSATNPSFSFRPSTAPFGSQSTPQMPHQPPAQALSTPQFFTAQLQTPANFNFGQSAPANTVAPSATNSIFQFSADQSNQAVVNTRNIKKAKRRLNPT